MNARKKRLGRGLDALLSKPVPETALTAETRAPAEAVESALREVPVEQLRRGEYQPRVDMRQESLAELADSIRSQGIVQPIVVRPVAGDGVVRYEIIAGERRWRAAQLAGLESVPAIVRDIEDEDAIAMGDAAKGVPDHRQKEIPQSSLDTLPRYGAKAGLTPEVAQALWVHCTATKKLGDL